MLLLRTARFLEGRLLSRTQKSVLPSVKSTQQVAVAIGSSSSLSAKDRLSKELRYSTSSKLEVERERGRSRSWPSFRREECGEPQTTTGV